MKFFQSNSSMSMQSTDRRILTMIFFDIYFIMIIMGAYGYKLTILLLLLAIACKVVIIAIKSYNSTTKFLLLLSPTILLVSLGHGYYNALKLPIVNLLVTAPMVHLVIFIIFILPVLILYLNAVKKFYSLR